MDICRWLRNSAPVGGRTPLIISYNPIMVLVFDRNSKLATLPADQDFTPIPTVVWLGLPSRRGRFARRIQPPGFSVCSFRSCRLQRKCLQQIHSTCTSNIINPSWDQSHSVKIMLNHKLEIVPKKLGSPSPAFHPCLGGFLSWAQLLARQALPGTGL